jgi:hypothetical protein
MIFTQDNRRAKHELGRQFLPGVCVILSAFSVNPHNRLLSVTLQQTGDVTGGTGQFAAATGSYTGTIRGQGLLPRNPTAAAPSSNHRYTRWT